MSFWEMTYEELLKERKALLVECEELNDLADEALANGNDDEYVVYIDDAYDISREIDLIEKLLHDRLATAIRSGDGVMDYEFDFSNSVVVIVEH